MILCAVAAIVLVAGAAILPDRYRPEPADLFSALFAPENKDGGRIGKQPPFLLAQAAGRPAHPDWTHPGIRAEYPGYARHEQDRNGGAIWQYHTNRVGGNIRGGGTIHFTIDMDKLRKRLGRPRKLEELPIPTPPSTVIPVVPSLLRETQPPSN